MQEAKRESSRCIGFVDLDAFYAAVEMERDPSLREVPVCVVQYETWNHAAPDIGREGDRRIKTGGAGSIAVNYLARARGVKRGMNAKEAREKCPELVCVQVPTQHGKADLSIYKEAGQRVVEELKKFAGIVEKRSVDEVAIDVTEAAVSYLATTTRSEVRRKALASSHLADSDESLEMAKVTHDQSRRGHDKQRLREDDDNNNDRDKDDEQDEGPRRDIEEEEVYSPEEEKDWSDADYLLFAGAVVVDRARKHVMDNLGYSCSAGIAETKMMAKVACGLHKPAQQTIVLARSARALLKDLPLNRLPGLGGALGERLSAALSATTAGEVAALDAKDLRRKAKLSSDDAERIASIVQGTYAEPVADRDLYKSFGASKTFFRNPLLTFSAVDKWLQGLVLEITDRTLKDRSLNTRAPTNATIHVTDDGKQASRTEKISFGWTGTLKTIQTSADRLFRRWADTKKHFSITVLGLNVSNFEPLPPLGKTTSLLSLLHKNPKKRKSNDATEEPPLLTDDAAPKTNGFDPEVFDALPEDIRAELLAAQQPPVTTEPAQRGLDPDVFDALPPDIQAELNDDRQRKQLLQDTSRQRQPPPPQIIQQQHNNKKGDTKKRTKTKHTAGGRQAATQKIDTFFLPSRRTTPP